MGAAGQTAFAIVLRPEASFRSFRPGGGFLKPTVYALLLGGPSLLLGIFLAVRLEGESMAAAGLGPAAALGLLILAPPLYVYLRAQLLQLALLFAGLARGSFESTFRLVSYANASVAPLLVLPFAGDFLFLITGAILESIALRHVHGLTVGRALLAEVLPATVLGVVLLAAGAIGLLWWSQTQG